MSKRRKHGKSPSPPRRRGHRWMWAALVVLTIVAAVTIVVMRRTPPMAPSSSPSSNEFNFRPTAANTTKPESPAPEGMVWIPGGEFSMGAQDPPDINDAVGMQATRDSRPIHRVYVDGFWMDETEVTNEQFTAFVKATGYMTVAERTPRAEDFPGAPKENLVAGSVMFTPPRK